VEQIHTHKGPSNKSLLLLKTPSEKSTTPLPPLFHHKDATEKYQFSNYNGNIYLTRACFAFPFLCQVVLKNAFWCEIPRNMGSTHVTFLILVFRSHFFAFRGTHTAMNSLTLHELVSVVP
jgi:hypothetical protein